MPASIVRTGRKRKSRKKNGPYTEPTRCISCDVDRVGLDGADLIERLTDRCARYAEEIAVAQEKTRWIPVTERLPDQCVDVLVRYRDKHILMGTARCDDWLDEDLEDGVITHWMRMPKGPEEE